ncbi:MAG: TonB-dependent receptor plug domain-containing protein [Alistipes sp.]|nr:TonB-dependent receptor plug domain-containing protein [Alistipes sp.]
MRNLLILLCCFSMATASLSAQSAKVSLEMDNEPLAAVLAAIEKQTNYLFIVNSQVDTKQTVSVSAAGKQVGEVLEGIFAGKGIAFDQEGTHIILSPKQNQSTQPAAAAALSGRVSDKNRNPLVGVSVVVKGTTTGTSTGADGEFSISARGDQVLYVSYLGYAPREIPVGAVRRFDITLEEDNIALESVVVTALGIKRSEKTLSYNVQTVTSEEITSVRDANFLNALSGKVAGVTINPSSSGIGGASRVVMRGVRSLTKSNNALYVIDGIPMINVSRGEIDAVHSPQFNGQTSGESIADINPDDIESMTVLNGAAAAALYGSDASNGAIIITTKKGRVGKPEIIFSNQTSFLSPFILPKFQTKYGNQPGVYDSWGGEIPGGTNYNVKDFFNIGSQVQTSLSISGGTDRNQTYLSVSNTTANGIIPTNTYDRNTLNFRNTSMMFDDRLTIDAGVPSPPRRIST